jgi:BirA family biotin operon repressor/biotin-[acetyl-CoA-carboxylase] ligase
LKFVSRRGVGEDLERARELILAKGGLVGRELHLLADAESTNDEAKRAAKSGAPHGSVWVAEVQTKGRGRQGRLWVSPPGENLLFSVLLRLDCPPARLPPLALVAGLAVRDAVARAAPKAQPKLKWPNDVLVVGRKIAGVLVEATLSGKRVEAVVVGIGINVHTRVFPEELEDRATSVGLVAEAPLDRGVLLADVLEGLDHDMALAADRGLGLVHARLTAADALVGTRVRAEGVEGVARGIDLEGQLVIERDDGVRVRVASGEVQLS